MSMAENQTPERLNENRIIYQVEEKPRNIRDALILGFQHPLTMIGGMAMTPLIVAGATGMNPSQATLLLSLCMMGSGLATILQTTIGVKLAVIQTMSVAFIAAYVTIATIVTAETGAPDPMLIMRYIGGAIILGGIFEVVIGYTGLIGKLRNVITPVVTGPLILLICLSLSEFIIGWASEQWIIALVTAAFSLTMSNIIPKTEWGKDKYYIKATSVIFPVVVMYIISLILSKVGIISPDSAAYIDLSIVADAPLFVLPVPGGNWGPPIFKVEFVLLILAGYVVSMIESVGQYYANATISEIKEPLTSKRIGRGIGTEGLGCMLSALLGGLSSTSAGENIGLVEATGVASRHIARIGGVFLILFGFFGKFASLFTTISHPILAGVFIAIMGSVGGVGIKEFAKVPLSGRNLSIMGISLIFGLGIPPYVAVNPVVIPGVEWLANTINGVLSNMMAVGGLVAILMNTFLSGCDDEKGFNVNDAQ